MYSIQRFHREVHDTSTSVSDQMNKGQAPSSCLTIFAPQPRRSELNKLVRSSFAQIFESQERKCSVGCDSAIEACVVLGSPNAISQPQSQDA